VTYSNFVPKVFEIFGFKNVIKSLEIDVIIVTMALSRVVSEIFNVEECRDMEIQVRGHSRSLKVVLFERLGMLS